jgi:transcriptional regulator with XRE-family HTH domain
MSDSPRYRWTTVDDQKQFGNRVRAARSAAKLSREVLSERVDITANYLGQIERGEKWPAFTVIMSLARAMHVSPAVFFDFDPAENDVVAMRKTLHAVVDVRNARELKQVLRIVRALSLE